MGLRIGTNVQSLTAQRNLGRATNALNRNFEHLSTGRRISSARDDAAGLGIAARFQAQVKSMDAAVRNANDGVSLVQTAEGGLAEIESSLIRMRELAVQANNGTLSSGDRSNLQAEFAQLISGIDQVAASTTFNSIQLLNSTTATTLQIGTGVVAAVDTLAVTAVDVDSTTLTVATLDISSGSTTTAIGAIDTALNSVTTARGGFGAIQNRLDSTIDGLLITQENLASARSRIIDVDVAAETAELTKNSILQQAALSVLAQANNQPLSALSLLQ
ncbi:MAG: flagellin FliC [Deltaproteobacteria bacterium]|nr:flagellin FliC [Deltaproteobacteria bacterium]